MTVYQTLMGNLCQEYGFENVKGNEEFGIILVTDDGKKIKIEVEEK